MLVYADTSALVKLVFDEPETESLISWMDEVDADFVTCDLTRTELMRVAQRIDAERAVEARDVLDACTILALDGSVFERAGLLAPSELRSLDAIHLAAAHMIGEELDGMLSYDARLAHAARTRGLRSVHPGVNRLVP